MVLLAMGFGPTLEMVIGFLLVLFSLVLFVVLCLIRLFNKSIGWSFICKLTLGFPLLIAVMLLVLSITQDFISTPMTVRKYHLEGDYVINRDLFRGENTQWQYDHYWIRVSGDTLYLNVMNNGRMIKQHKRHITYVPYYNFDHAFIKFYDYAYNSPGNAFFRLEDERKKQLLSTANAGALGEGAANTVQLSRNVTHGEINSRSARIDSLHQHGHHHMLKQNPILHADPFSFNLVLRSTKYQNMFFTKGKWKKREE